MPNSVLQSWLPFSSFLSIGGIPKSFGCVFTTYSKKRMEVSETQRDSNPLEMLTFFFNCSQPLVGAELEPFHCGEIWSLTPAAFFLLLLTHWKRQSGGVG